MLTLKKEISRTTEDIDGDDVLNTKNELSNMGYYKADEKVGMNKFTDEGLFKGISGFQKDNRLKVDEVMKPGGETESKINEMKSVKSENTPKSLFATSTLFGNPTAENKSEVMQTPRPNNNISQTPVPQPKNESEITQTKLNSSLYQKTQVDSSIKISKPINRTDVTEQSDVKNVKGFLKTQGYYEENPKTGLNGFTDEPMFEGLKKFQKDNGLKVDGIMKPDGETERKINELTAKSNFRNDFENKKEMVKENELSKSILKDKIKLSDGNIERPSFLNDKTMEKMSENLSGLKVNQFDNSKNVPDPTFDSLYKKSKPDYKLGSLSAEYESNHNPAAIGKDNTGGYSYGEYQIETKNGTMMDYIFYLGKKPEYKKYFDKIKEAGGYEAAKAGSPAFLKGWPEWSKDKAFAESQFAFLRDKKLNPVLQRIKDIKGLNFEDRHPVLLDVIYSMSVNHGGASDVIKKALGQDASKLSDEEMINKLYSTRIEYVKGLKDAKGQNNIENKKNMITIRYPNERQKALNFLKK